MKSQALTLKLKLQTEQTAKLIALQVRFASACNSLMPLVRETLCWNRVTLHHIAYRKLRESFPDLGSQMACNAIYSVSLACRHVFQSPQSPFFRARGSQLPLPDIRFLPTSPVFFDRHTISIKNGMLSMFTLEGRMRFCVLLSDDDEARFRREKLREVMLIRQCDVFQLNFIFGGDAAIAGAELPQFALILPETCDPAAVGTHSAVLQVTSRTENVLHA